MSSKSHSRESRSSRQRKSAERVGRTFVDWAQLSALATPADVFKALECSPTIDGAAKLQAALKERGFDDDGFVEALQILAGLEVAWARDVRSLTLESLGWTDLSPLRTFTKLENLRLKRFYVLESLEALGTCPHLRKLSLRSCGSLSSLQSLSGCKKLRRLSISRAPMLTSLDGLEGCKQLVSLSLSLSALEDAQALQTLRKLRWVQLLDASELEALGFSGARYLFSLNVSYCKSLRSIDGLAAGLELRYLSIRKCPSLRQLGGIKGCKNLISLSLEECAHLPGLPTLIRHASELKSLSMEGFTERDGLEVITDHPRLESLSIDDASVFTQSDVWPRCAALQELRLSGWGAKDIRRILDACPQVTSLTLSECSELETLECLGEGRALERLTLERCQSLKNLRQLQHLTNLRKLVISGCDEVTSLGFLLSCPQIEELNYSGKTAPEPAIFADCAWLKRLALHEISIGRIDELPALTHLKSLRIHRFDSLQSLKGLNVAFPILEKLQLDWCDALTSLEGVQGHRSLQELDVYGCDGLLTLDGLGDVPNLSGIDLRRCDKLHDLKGLRDCSELRSLSVRLCDSITSLDGLQSSPSLRSLSVYGCHELRDIAALGMLTELETLTFSGWQDLSVHSLLKPHAQLRDLSLFYFANEETLDALSSCTKLQFLSVEYFDALRSLDGLSHCPELQKLILHGFDALDRSVRGLSGLSKLSSLYLCDVPESLMSACAWESLEVFKLPRA